MAFPRAVVGSAWAFIEGEALYVQGGMTFDAENNYSNKEYLDQFLAVDLSASWTTSEPRIKPLVTIGSPKNIYHSAIVSQDHSRLYVFSLGTETKVYEYSIKDSQWRTLPAPNTAAAAAPKMPSWGGKKAPVLNPETGDVLVPSGFPMRATGVLNMTSFAYGAVEQPRAIFDVFGYGAVWNPFNKTLLLFGGEAKLDPQSSNSTFLNSAWEYDPRAKTWSSVTFEGDVVPSPRSLHCMVPAYNSTKMVIFGGRNDKWLSDLYIFDLRSRTWTKGASNLALDDRDSPACAVSGDYFISYGGFVPGQGGKTEVLVYNLKEQQWSDRYEPPSPNAPPPPPPPSASSPPPSSAKTAKGTNVGAIIGGVIGGLVVITVCIAFFVLHRRKQRRIIGAPQKMKDGEEERDHAESNKEEWREGHGRGIGSFSKNGSTPPSSPRNPQLGVVEARNLYDQLGRPQEYPSNAASLTHGDENSRQPRGPVFIG